MRLTLSAAIVVSGLGLSGCASAGFHQVSFAGETSLAGSAPPNGKSVHVVRNVRMKDTILEAKIRYKLEEFLLSRGYSIAPSDTADLYVLATYGTGERMVAGIAPVYRDAEVRSDRNRMGTRTYIPARMDYLRVPLVKKSLWLQVLSSDAKYFRSTGQIKNLWRGEAAIVGRPEVLPETMPFLIIPTLKYFGKSTPDIVTVDVREHDAAWK